MRRKPSYTLRIAGKCIFRSEPSGAISISADSPSSATRHLFFPENNIREFAPPDLLAGISDRELAGYIRLMKSVG